MNKVNGKGLALAGSIVSVVFTLIGILVGIIYTFALMDPELFKEEFANGMADPSITRDEALQFAEDIMPIIRVISNVLVYGGLILLVLGILGIIFSRIVKFKSKKGMGIYFIITAVLHFFFLRILASILLLISGIQMLTSKETIVTEGIAQESDVFDEVELYE